MCYDRIKFGNKIYNARKRAGLKQIEVCTKLGIGQSTYSKIESGKQSITLDKLYKLCDIVNVSIYYLLDSGIDDFSNEELLEIENFKNYVRSKRKDSN